MCKMCHTHGLMCLQDAPHTWIDVFARCAIKHGLMRVQDVPRTWIVDHCAMCGQGATMPSRQLAKMAVALQMCELLFKAGKCCVQVFTPPGLESRFLLTHTHTVTLTELTLTCCYSLCSLFVDSKMDFFPMAPSFTFSVVTLSV